MIAASLLIIAMITGVVLDGRLDTTIVSAADEAGGRKQKMKRHRAADGYWRQPAASSIANLPSGIRLGDT